jgi:hypothetical protein
MMKIKSSVGGEHRQMGEARVAGRRSWRRATAFALLLAGTILFVIAGLGEWAGVGVETDPDVRSWERFDPDLAARTRSLDALYEAAQSRAEGDLRQMPPAQAMEVLFDTVNARFTHGETEHTLLSNWILWTLGLVNPKLGGVRSPEVLLDRYQSALCGRVSFVLMNLAERAGIRPRHVGLNGHVVMEAWYDDEWHMYDPDFEIAPRRGTGPVLSVDAFSRDPALVRELYVDKKGADRVQIVIDKIISREDNSFVSYPVGSQFEWKSQVLLLFEKAAEVLKFAVPIVFLAVGMALILLDRRGRLQA